MVLAVGQTASRRSGLKHSGTVSGDRAPNRLTSTAMTASAAAIPKTMYAKLRTRRFSFRCACRATVIASTITSRWSASRSPPARIDSAISSACPRRSSVTGRCSLMKATSPGSIPLTSSSGDSRSTRLCAAS